MIERMPEATTHMLAGSLVQNIVAGIGIGRGSIMLRLYQHSLFAPVTGNTAGRIMRIPIVYVIAPLTGKISLCIVRMFQSPFRVCILWMGEKNRKHLMSACFAVTTAIAGRIRIFGMYNIVGVLGKVRRIPGLVQDRFHSQTEGWLRSRRTR